MAGDTVTVAYRIKEGNKERIQQYRGVVIRINGHEDKKRFTVRKVSDGIGVERIFPIESPFIESITVNKYGKVRRCKTLLPAQPHRQEGSHQRALREESRQIIAAIFLHSSKINTVLRHFWRRIVLYMHTAFESMTDTAIIVC